MNMPAGPPRSAARQLTDELRPACQVGDVASHQRQLHPRGDQLQMVLDGGVLRQRYLPDGRRQTVAIYYRDDVVNLGRFVTSLHGDDYLLALKGTVIGTMAPDVVHRLRGTARHGMDGMTAMVFRELGIAEERLLSLGQRSALEAMAHFMCETLQRCGEPGKDFRIERCRLCMTQDTLATVLGISAVHVNRTLQQLRARKLATLIDSELVVHDFEGLAELAGFDSAYLAPL